MLGFTIDTVKLYLSPEYYSIDQFIFMKHTFCYKNSLRGEIEWFFGNEKNISFRISENHGLFIQGSLSNYICGSRNILPLEEIEMVIILLSRKLNLDLRVAKIYRIDLALNINPSDEARKYSRELLVDLPKFKRLVQDDGLRFQNKSFVFAFYNKSKELLEKKGINSIDEILRFEFRISKKVNKCLGVNELQVKDLFHPETLIVLIEKFEEYFVKIRLQKISVSTSPSSQIKPSTFNEFLMLHGIKAMGEANIYELIEQLHDEKRIVSSVDKTRCKQNVSNLLDKYNYDIHPLAKELKTLVLEEVESKIKYLRTKINANVKI